MHILEVLAIVLFTINLVILFMKPRPKIQKVETNLYDQEEIFTDCTVQVWTNSVTGETSVGWWRNNHPPKEPDDE